ncbi:hypothetical protein [Flavobacterium sp.]|uniref:glucosamine inositolphosphorylceramide transferase family protein n=1 Tax=Flavobacterium sp. TaxID=239 RepID=UPI0025C51AD6|nr:hypothetical protein [Flavobacterium sp.]
MKKNKLRILIALALLSVAVVLFVNSRTPFFLQQGGPWSVGFGFSETSLPKVKTDNLFTPEMLQKDEKNTEFLADPFFVKHQDSFYIFFEHKHFTPHKANISVLKSPDGIHYKYGGVVLDEPFHLSYPQVFEKGGKTYMVPESAHAGAILLYESDKFPSGWKVVDTLVKGNFKDPSIYVSDTLNIMVASDDALTLHFFKADSLGGQWKKMGWLLKGSEARAGGRIFEHDGKLILPVQDGARGYGSALSLYEFQFAKDEVRLEKIADDYLEAHPEIPQLSFGMHQFDIQKVGNGYYYVFDGNRVKSSRKKLSVWYAVKQSIYDFKNLFR